MRHQELDNSRQPHGANVANVRAAWTAVRLRGRLIVMTMLLCLVSGCAKFESIWNRPVFWGTQPPPVYEDPTPYRNWASEIDYPEAVTAPHSPELFVAEPRRLRNLEKEEIWDMSLEQAIQIALSNSEVVRRSGQFVLGPNINDANPVLDSPEFVPSSLDPAIQESGVLFGQRGVEAALSEFDTQFTTTMVWGRDEQIQNSSIGTGIPPGQTQTQETGNFSMGLTKRLASGGIIGVINDWNYLGTNTNDFIPNARLFPSSYTGRVRVEARQPLWAGAGTEYTRIAGPVTEQIQGVTGVQQGVVIARINNDIALTEFEGAIRDQLRDVEELYWLLYRAYQTYHVEMSLLNDVLESYERVEAKVTSESPYAAALQLMDARDFYYLVKGRVDLARNNLYDFEAQLRRLIGLTVNDGRVIRPLDEPMLAEFVPDWNVMLSGALARRIELRRQKWKIRQLELQLRAAEHLVMPRLDFVAAYQINGFGDDLLGSTRDGQTPFGLGNAVATLTRGDQTGWNLGFEFSLPFGMRFAHAQVSNLEFQLAKARAVLAQAEKDVSHELARTFRDLDQTYFALQSSFNRKRNAAERLRAIEQLHQDDPQRYPEEAILQSRDRLAEVEKAYLLTMSGYNIAVMELHYRAGKLLELNNVQLSEGPWDEEAEYDVLDRGYDRWHSLPTKTMMHAAPEPFVFRGSLVPEGTIADEYGPAQGGWMSDVPKDWDLPVPVNGDELAPSPGTIPQPTPGVIPERPLIPRRSGGGRTTPDRIPPDEHDRDQHEQPPSNGPVLRTAEQDVFPPLVPGVQETGAPARQRADGLPISDTIWNLQMDEGSRRTANLPPSSLMKEDRRIPTAENDWSHIRRISAESTGYPPTNWNETLQQWRSKNADALLNAHDEPGSVAR